MIKTKDIARHRVESQTGFVCNGRHFEHASDAYRYQLECLFKDWLEVNFGSETLVRDLDVEAIFAHWSICTRSEE